MRYAIVDLDGASRAYFDTRGDVRGALQELEDECPGIIADLYVVAYRDDGGRMGGPEPAGKLLRSDDVLLAPLDWSDASLRTSLAAGIQDHIETRATTPVVTRQSAGAHTQSQVVPA